MSSLSALEDMAEKISLWIQDALATPLKEAADESTGGNVSKYINEAIRDRLDREGRLPHQRTPEDVALEKAKATLEVVGPVLFSEMMDEARARAAVAMGGVE